ENASRALRAPADGFFGRGTSNAPSPEKKPQDTPLYTEFHECFLGMRFSGILQNPLRHGHSSVAARRPDPRTFHKRTKLLWRRSRRRRFDELRIVNRDVRLDCGQRVLLAAAHPAVGALEWHHDARNRTIIGEVDLRRNAAYRRIGVAHHPQ